jgi:histidine triad (HIT) family protein
MEDCIFCKIIAGEAPASIFYRDAVCVAFLDIRPINRGHALVVPLQHHYLLGYHSDETAGHLLKVGKWVGQALRESGIPCDGVNFMILDGKDAGQEVLHTHLHVIPRAKADGFGFRFPEAYGKMPGRKELEADAERLRQQMSS